MFGVKKIEKVIADELYAAQRDALNQAGVVEQVQHELDVATARLTMLNNRVRRLQSRADAHEVIKHAETQRSMAEGGVYG